MNARDEIERFLPLAASISDGDAPDWGEAESGAGDEASRALVRELRIVAEIARAHTTLPRDAGAVRPGTSSAPRGGGAEGRERSGPASDERARPPSLGAEPPRTTLGVEPIGAWGPLRLLEKIGEGTYGEVYRAWDPRLDREEALKLFRSGALAGEGSSFSIVDEGRMLARVHHPNVVAVHGADQIDGRTGLWMEFVRGRTLEELLREQGPFGARETCLIGVDLASALAAVHGAGLIHGDIKAQNIMREEGGRILLMDFGSGRQVEARPVDSEAASLSGPAASLSGTGASLSGTPLYMAPEVLEGVRATSRSDIFSLGVLLYHLVTGTYPLRARSLKDLRQAHARRAMRLLRDERPGLPEGFTKIVERALAWEPENRFATAGEMGQALAESLGVGGRTDVAIAGKAVGAAALSGAAVSDAAVADKSPAQGVLSHRGLSGAAVTGTKVANPEGYPIADSHGKGSPVAGGFLHRRWLVIGVAGSIVAIVALLFLSPALRDRLLPGGTPYTVRASLVRGPASRAEPLSAGARVAPGDQLSLEFEGSTSLYVYVLNEDERGESYLLFPLPGFEITNPLPAGKRHRLPGTWNGEPVYWRITSAGGREHFLLVASPQRLVNFESEMLALARPLEDRPLMATPLSEDATLRLRGVGGLIRQPAGPPAAPGAARRGKIFELARKLSDTPESARGVFVRTIDLENPAP